MGHKTNEVGLLVSGNWKILKHNDQKYSIGSCRLKELFIFFWFIEKGTINWPINGTHRWTSGQNSSKMIV